MIARCALLSLALLSSVTMTAAQADRSSTSMPDLSGVYQAISSDTVLTGGLRNAGSPSEIDLVPAALAQAKAADLSQDPDKNCQPVGPFRMMAREGNKIELQMVPARGLMFMLFEDVSRGHMRTVRLNQSHPEKVEPTWHGHSVARWEGDALVVDTVGFNERTWLNAAGAAHSEAMHLVERLRPVSSGKYLEYKVTVEDPAVLKKPYTYTRYYERVKADIADAVCEQ